MLIIRKIALRINYWKYKIKLYRKVKFRGFTIIYQFPGATINFGANIIINSDLFSNFIGINHPSIIIARDGGKITIGNDVGMSGCTLYSLKEIDIGDRTIIGGNCKIIDNDFHPLSPHDRFLNIRENIKKQKIIIGENVFIGANSIILKGTVIGNNSIVGAGSIVKGIFPDNVILGGNPAKVISEIRDYCKEC